MFNPKLSKVMQKVLFITEVAILAEEVKNNFCLKNKKYQKDFKGKGKWLFHSMHSSVNLDKGDGDDDADDNSDYDRKFSYEDDVFGNSSIPETKYKKNVWFRMKTSARNNDIRGKTGVIDRLVLEKLLGEWEEPKVESDNLVRKVLVSVILKDINSSSTKLSLIISGTIHP
jgi:hypothetical protein